MDAQDFTDVIQVCTDGSSLSEKGVTTAVELAKTLGLPLLGMTVVKGDAPENGLEGEPQEVRDRLQTIVEEAEAPAFGIRLLPNMLPRRMKAFSMLPCATMHALS